MVMDAIRLAGITPTGAGYRIAPRYPFRRFSLRLPQIGVASESRRVRGYVTPRSGGPLVMRVELPPGAKAGTLETWAGGHLVPHTVSHGFASFRLPTSSNRPANWALTWGSASPPHRPPHGGHHDPEDER
jgi:hypothetical protein